MPEPYIIYRNKYKDLASDWEKKYFSLSNAEKEEFESIIADNHFGKDTLLQTSNTRIK